jgi:hypothetical protein
MWELIINWVIAWPGRWRALREDDPENSSPIGVSLFRVHGLHGADHAIYRPGCALVEHALALVACLCAYPNVHHLHPVLPELLASGSGRRDKGFFAHSVIRGHSSRGRVCDVNAVCSDGVLFRRIRERRVAFMSSLQG